MWECVGELVDVTLDGQRIYLLCRCGNVSVKLVDVTLDGQRIYLLCRCGNGSVN